MSFHFMRRQQFLNEDFYKKKIELFEQGMNLYLEVLHAKSSNSDDRRRVSAAIAEDVFENFVLKYSAGVSIDGLRGDFESVVASFEQAAKYEREFESKPTFPPLLFGDIAQYERAMQLISLCYLLHRRDLLQRVADLFDGAYAAKDTLYEDLLSYELEERFEVDQRYHNKPYRHLINSLYHETSEEINEDLEKYLKEWYPAMELAPWHDGHLRISMGGGGGYFGYWAMEAAAVVYFLEVDDSNFRDHIVYPKDLVGYAYKIDDELQKGHGMEADSSLRALGGELCPKTGFWFTPAQQNNRCFFKAGQVMPAFEKSDYGATIWQWSDEQ